jgi:hypothetical protein
MVIVSPGSSVSMGLELCLSCLQAAFGNGSVELCGLRNVCVILQ